MEHKVCERLRLVTPLTEQNVLEFLCKSVRDESHWRPSKSLAKCLAVPYQRLLVTTRKDDLANLVWNTVLVLSTFVTRFVDHHEQWYGVGEAASAWLYRQMHFVEHREDLVRSACTLLQIRDPASILTTLFAEPKDEATLALEAALGADWKLCYLQEPPYSLYYWNEKTNHSTWRNPLETAKLLKEMEEQKVRKAELVAKYLPQRLKINRDLLEVVQHSCGECRRDAQVLCIDCNSKYFCESCCDERHCEASKLAHIDTGFRFIDCFGRNGFPNNRNTLQQRQQPHEEVAQSSNI
uniref:WW domain-containing protein n=1 Tax=Globisporangium ultimum (strain ATCC 200006 / CBS 805.95 / DAOM BR144) TaxID=431595 RepID=K3WN32_GLOUD